MPFEYSWLNTSAALRPGLSYTMPFAGLKSHERTGAGRIPRRPQVEMSSIVGKSVPRKEGRDKVTGRSLYVDDMVLPGMLFGATVRSQVPRGRIKNITFGAGIAWD